MARGVMKLADLPAEVLDAVRTFRWDRIIEKHEQTFQPGHYTLWGDPAVLLGCLTRVVPI